MNRGIIFRLIIFFAMITLLVGLIGWIAHTSWQRTGDLQKQLSEKQWQSFLIADYLQKTILSQDNSVMRYAAYHQDADWAAFTKSSRELGRWLNEQQPLFKQQVALEQQLYLASPDPVKERDLLDQINIAYNRYLDAAALINNKIYGAHQTITRVSELAELDANKREILDLGIKLSETHQRWIDDFQNQSIKSLNFLRYEVLGALIVLSIAVLWLSFVVYREMIAPLQVQLVESRQMMQQQEKLASLGMLAAGVAHEIRNPLTAIKAWLYLQQKHLQPGTPEFSDAQVIGGEINRLERIVRDFLQFARPTEPQFSIVDAGQPLHEVRTLLQPGLEKNGVHIVIGDVADGRIRIDTQQIKQVLINLVQNAADSIGRDGTITLRAVADEKRIADHQIDVIILEVSDTGKGISDEAQKRLFDPFFTTKDTGTGLGLPIAARIVEKHGGALQYQNLAEQGATFGIILPARKP
jgi:signal transduction histidine kinase